MPASACSTSATESLFFDKSSPIPTPISITTTSKSESYHIYYVTQHYAKCTREKELPCGD